MLVLLRDKAMIAADSAELVIKTADGRTGDHHEFRLSGTLLRATLDSTGSTVTVWASESALPDDAYHLSTGSESRYLRLMMSRDQAKILREAITGALHPLGENSL